MKKYRLGLILALCLCVITGGVYAAWTYVLDVTAVQKDLTASLEGKSVTGGGTLSFQDVNFTVAIDDSKDGKFNAKAVVKNDSSQPVVAETITVTYTPRSDETVDTNNTGLGLKWWVEVVDAESTTTKLGNLVDGETGPNKFFTKYTTSDAKIDAGTLTESSSYTFTISLKTVEAQIQTLINPSFTLPTPEKYDAFESLWRTNEPKFKIVVDDTFPKK